MGIIESLKLATNKATFGLLFKPSNIPSTSNNPVNNTNEVDKRVNLKEVKKKARLIPEIGTNGAYTDIAASLDFGIYQNPDRSELLNELGFADAERVLRDPQVQACYSTLIFSVLSKPLTIKANGDSEESQLLKEFIDVTIKSIKDNFDSIFYSLSLSGLHFGYGLSEKIYDFCPNGKFIGKLILKEIKNKKPGLFSFKLDEFENILGIENLAAYNYLNDDEIEVLAKEKFLVFSFLKLFNNPYGQDVFSRLSKFVTIKNQMLQDMAIESKKTAMGTGLVGIPPDLIDDTNSVSQAQDVADALGYGNSIAYPIGLDIKLLETSQTTDKFLPRLKYLDSQISLAILGNDLTTSQSQGGGTHAESKVKFEVTSIFSQFLQKYLQELFNEQIINDLLAYNFDKFRYPKDIYPTAEFMEVKQENIKQNAEIISIGIDKGLLKFEEKVSDEIFIREQLKFPKLSDEEIENRQQQEELYKPTSILEQTPIEKLKDIKSKFYKENNIEIIDYNLAA